MNHLQAEAIKKHGQKLLAIYPNATERDPVELCKKLRKLEAQAHAIALRLCNGPQYPGGYDAVDRRCDTIIEKVHGLLGIDGPLIFVNRDPRGYALKIPDNIACNLDITKDWGGYGIIAPEISKEGWL